MKTILVDAINTLIKKNEGINIEIYNLLETYPNKKIILTNANINEIKRKYLNGVTYEIFSLENNPRKTEPEYYIKMLKYFDLSNKEVIYFEHNKEAIKSAKSIGIKTYFYNGNINDLKKYLDENI